MATTAQGLVELDLHAARAGDVQAFARVVAASQSTVTSIALAITRDVAASEDIAQDAFLNAWQNLRRLHSTSSFLPWLRQITRNLARDHLRAKPRWVSGGDDIDALIANVADAGPQPDQKLADAERLRVAADLISALPEDSRETLLLYYRENQSSQQVAALLGLSDAAVRKRLSRARASVREDLLARFGELARGSAPSAAFTAAVASAVALASPPAAAAAVVGLGGAGAQFGLKAILGSAGLMAAGILTGVAGIYYETRWLSRGAVDDAERAALRRSGWMTAASAAVFAVLVLAVPDVDRGGWSSVGLTAAFVAFASWQVLVQRPRIMARRHALDASRDPVAAARQRRRERLRDRVCVLAGAAVALGLVAYAEHLAGHF